MKFVRLLSKLLNSRIFYMFAVFVVFFGIALERIMRLTTNAHINASSTEIFFLVAPLSILLLLISAFLIVVKKRPTDYAAVALIFTGLILHRPILPIDFLNAKYGLTQRISEFPFNYSFYLACAGLIVFLAIQIKNNKYKISLR
jgi:hypothetical protein